MWKGYNDIRVGLNKSPRLTAVQCERTTPTERQSWKVRHCPNWDLKRSRAAHPDLEVFRLRLGKALDFDYFEDWQGSLFSRADPRNGGPSLDVERAMNKLEKVAIRYARKNGRPLVLAFNSTSPLLK